MEDLNKNQLILLTLLITFVTSISASIMTVSLLQEAPLEVTRNINRIVEKTIETVTPGVVTPSPKEVTTVIVKEEDLIVESINKNLKSIVRIKEANATLQTDSFYGIGLVINKEGLIAADKKTITAGSTYVATMSDGTKLNLTPTNVDKQTNFILFKPGGVATSTVFAPAVFGESEPKLGQTLISLGGETSNGVAVGRVISLQVKDSGTGTSTVKLLQSIDTDVAIKDIVDGSPAFNLSGDLVGVKLSSDNSKSFTPISVLKKELNILIETPKTEPKTP